MGGGGEDRSRSGRRDLRKEADNSQTRHPVRLHLPAKPLGRFRPPCTHVSTSFPACRSPGLQGHRARDMWTGPRIRYACLARGLPASLFYFPLIHVIPDTA